MAKYLLVGVTSGLGLDVFKRLMTDENNTIIVLARSLEKLEKILEEHKDTIKANISYEQWDCVRCEDLHDVIQKLDLKDLDYVLHAAVYRDSGGFESIKRLDYKMLRNNYECSYFSFVCLIHELIYAKARKHPMSIVGCSSFATSSKASGISEYIGSKVLLENFVECRKKELLRYNIRVNLIRPAYLDVPSVAQSLSCLYESKEAFLKYQPAGLIPLKVVSDEIFNLWTNPYYCGEFRSISAGVSVGSD